MSNISTVRSLKSKLFVMIQSLPDDIKKYIYKEFLELEIKYNVINNHFLNKCRHMTTASSDVLAKYVKIIINNDKLRDLFIERSSEFNAMYKSKIERKEQYFTLIKGFYKDFAVGWIYIRYH
jgi:hypothetical protein